MKDNNNYKKRNVAILLAFFLGGLGAHKFYLDKGKQGIVYALFCWTGIPCIIALVELIMYISYSQEKWDAKFNS